MITRAVAVIYDRARTIVRLEVGPLILSKYYEQRIIRDKWHCDKEQLFERVFLEFPLRRSFEYKLVNFPISAIIRNTLCAL